MLVKNLFYVKFHFFKLLINVKIILNLFNKL